jgi:hypothetical protein
MGSENSSKERQIVQKLKVIARGRQTGKTTELIKRSAETGFPIVCRHRVAANVIQEQAKNLNLKIPDPITYFDFISPAFRLSNKTPVLIDGGAELLAFYSPVPIDTITIETETTEAEK